MTHDRCRLHESQTESRKDRRLVSRVCKHFPPPNAEASGDIRIGKDVLVSNAPAVIYKYNVTSDVIDFNVKKPVEPCKSFRVTNQDRITPSLPQYTTERRLQHMKMQLTKRPMERKTVWETQ